MNLNVAQQVGISQINEQQNSFSKSSLPKTMRTANLYRRGICKQTLDYPKKWSFEDKVLVWLFPSFKNKCEDFYNNNGPKFDENLNKYQLEHIDKDLYEILNKKLNCELSSYDKQPQRLLAIDETTQCLKLISRTFRHFDTLSQFLIEITEILDRSDDAEKSLSDVTDAVIKVEKKLLNVFKRVK